MNTISQLLNLNLSDNESEKISSYSTMISRISGRLPEISSQVFMRRHYIEDNCELECMFGKLVHQVSEQKIDPTQDLIEQLNLKEAYICLTLDQINRAIAPPVNQERIHQRQKVA